VNVPLKTNCTAATGAKASDRAQAQEHVFTLLRSVQRGFRRQYLELAGDHGLPFPLAGPGLALLQEISEHPGVTVNEVARLAGLPKSRVSVLMSGLAAQGVVRKESDPHDSRLVRLYVTPEGFGHIVEWSELAQQAMSHLLQPLSDEELVVVAQGLAALQRALRLAGKPSSGEQHPTTELPC
jgi:DNA-binding MarR family transcriptional regulator